MDTPDIMGSGIAGIGAVVLAYLVGLWIVLQIVRIAATRTPPTGDDLRFLGVTLAWFAWAFALFFAADALSSVLHASYALFEAPFSLLERVLSILFLCAIAVALHVSTMAMAGLALRQGVRTVSYGYGPTLAARRLGKETEIRASALPLGGFVRFDEDFENRPVPQIAIALSGNIALLAFGCLVLGAGETAALARAVLGHLVGSALGFSAAGTVEAMYAYIDAARPVEAAAAGCIAIAVFNLLPVPFFNGGQVLLSLWCAVSGRKLPDGAFQALSLAGMGVLLYVLALFLLAILIGP